MYYFEKNKRIKGITLIALVVSIIVILILAGISISMLFGDNSILKQAVEVKKISEEKEISEKVQLAYMATISEEKGEITEQKLINALDAEFGLENYELMENFSGVTIGEKEFLFNGEIRDIQLAEVTGISDTSITIDGAYLLTAVVEDENNSKVKWSSANTNVASVTSEGVVKCGTEPGETIITCTGSNNSSATCTVISTACIASSHGTGSPVIPSGFTAIDTKDAKWSMAVAEVNKGLVVMDSKGNEFVWIPVNDPSEMFGILINGDYSGKLYTDWSGTGIEGTYNPLNWTETGENMTITTTSGSKSSREPATLSSYDNGQTYTPTGTSETKTYLSIITDVINARYKNNNEYENMTNFGNTMQEDYKKMIQSVVINKGFYIGRYESSIVNNKTRVIAGARVMTAEETSANRWYGLYAKQKNFAIENGLTSVESSMVWGSQYDAMINWMMKNGVDVTSASPKMEDGITTAIKNSDSINRITGSQRYLNDKLKNVFDLLGNSYEWSIEACSVNLRVRRGGYYDTDYSIDHRNTNYPYNKGTGNGSRITIYIK